MFNEIKHNISEAITRSLKNSQDKVKETLTVVEEISEKLQEQIKYKRNAKKSINHKILMIGGRRAGKSTILSSILTSLRQTPGAICTVLDKTDYTTLDDSSTNSTLDIKQNEIKNYIKKRNMNSSFIVDMTPSYIKSSYILEISADGVAVNFEFIDVPGEWMKATDNNHAKLREEVQSTDVFIIAIDTPFLMNETDTDGSINDTYNRIKEIVQLMAYMKIKNPSDQKQIILCPVKCEKWINNNETDKIINKVQLAYRDLINRWIDQQEVTIHIMPIQTVGGIEWDKMLPASLFFKDKNDRQGISCSYDPTIKEYINQHGDFLEQTPTSRIENDKSWSINFVDIPLSWYKLNGKGYKPRYCEQIGYHILKFLIAKEENIQSSKKRNQYLEWILNTFIPTFGENLPKWKNVILRLEESKLINESENGFIKIHQKIN